MYGVNVLNFSRLTGSLVLGLSLISHTSFAFIDASALSAIVPTVPVPKKPKDLSQASDYVAPADATDSTSSGSSASAPAAYKRKNPGSKLKTAVTGKVKPGSKAAKRRKSFCARSKGWTGERGKAARRRWKC